MSIMHRSIGSVSGTVRCLFSVLVATGLLLAVSPYISATPSASAHSTGIGDLLPRIECSEAYTAIIFAEGLSSPDGLAFSPAGELYIAEETAGRVSRVGPGGQVTTVVSGLADPEGIAFDAAGNLYVVEDVQNGRLLRIAPGGEMTELATGREAPEGVVWSASDDTVYITESNVQFASHPLYYQTRVTAIPAGGVPAILRTDSLYWSYAGIVLGADGLLYVTNEASGVGTEESVFTVDPATGVRTLFATGLVSPEGLRFAASGAFPLYVAEEDTGGGTGRLTRVEADGSHTPFCTGFYNIEDVAVDENGHIYVSEDTTGLIIVLIPDVTEGLLGSSVSIASTSGDVEALVPEDLDRDGWIDVAYGDGAMALVARNTSGLSGTWSVTHSVGTATGELKGLVTGDLNRDGYADLVTLASLQIRLWENPGAAFDEAWGAGTVLTSPAGVTQTAVIVADLDLDGALDVATGAVDGTIRLWRNPMAATTPRSDLTGPWTTTKELSATSSVIVDIGWGDLDHDGKPDLVVLSDESQPTIRLWRNPGAAFHDDWSETRVLSGTGLLSLTVGSRLSVVDLDGDNWLDVVIGEDDGNLYAWRNPGTTPFDVDWDTRTNLGDAQVPLRAIVSADLDRDASPELIGVTTGALCKVIVWQGGQNPFGGVWEANLAALSADAVFAIALADLDGDGDADVVTGGQGGIVARPNLRPHQRMWFDHAGQNVGATGHQIAALQLADLDGDGKPGLVTGDAFGQVTAWHNDGPPFADDWTPHVLSAGPRSYVSALASGDLDNDGDLDIVTGRRWSNELTILENDTTPFVGAWPSWEIGTASAPVGALTLADVNGDGRLDVITGGGVSSVLTPTVDNHVTVWLGASFDTTWQAIDVGQVYYAVQGIAVGDLDNDGDLDIVIGTNHAPPEGSTNKPVPQDQWPDVYQVRAFRNDGTLAWHEINVGRDPKPRTFEHQYHGFWGSHITSVALADMDRDGDLDIVSTSSIEGDFPVMAWENSGTPFSGELWQGTAIALGQYWYGLCSDVTAAALGDFDRDGDTDVATVSRLGLSDPAGLIAWENTGVVFSTIVSETHWMRYNVGQIEGNTLAISAADIDRDGDLDLASGAFLAAEPNAVRVWENGNEKTIRSLYLPVISKQS